VECLGQKIGSFDVVGKEDMQVRSWRVSKNRRLLDKKSITKEQEPGRVLPTS
jgi:hypothetical protein